MSDDDTTTLLGGGIHTYPPGGKRVSDCEHEVARGNSVTSPAPLTINPITLEELLALIRWANDRRREWKARTIHAGWEIAIEMADGDPPDFAKTWRFKLYPINFTITNATEQAEGELLKCEG